MPDIQKSSIVLCVKCNKSFKTVHGLKIHTSKIHKSACVSESIIRSEHEYESVKDGIEDSTSLVKLLTNLKRTERIVHRIPKTARHASASALSDAIEKCIESNSYISWKNLLLFAYQILSIPSPSDSNPKLSLTKVIKYNINKSTDSFITKSFSEPFPPKFHITDNSKLVINKVADGDLSSAIRILSSSDTLAPYDQSTLSVLQLKHPRSNLSTSEFLVMKPDTIPLQVSRNDVLLAVKSFRTGSAGGLDAIRPSHIQDLLSYSTGSAREKLLNSLTKLCNLMLIGDVPSEICPIIYGASLCALKKRDGGIRPIAVGSFYRRLVAKLCCAVERENLGNYFRPLQFGFGTSGGCEAVAHSARLFINQHPNPEHRVFLKLDYKNAFNMVERKIMLQNVINFVPKLFPFLNQCYQSSSILNFGEYIISSERGIQQGDPLGPALFCLSIHDLIRTISCEFNCWYLDDGSIAGNVASVLENFERIIQKSEEIGLELNFEKCELIYLSEMDEDSVSEFRRMAPGIKLTNKAECSLLGAPLTLNKLSECLQEKTNSLKIMSTRLEKLPAHVGFFLLKNCISIPKLMYILRCCPTWKISVDLEKFDNLQRDITEKIININLTEPSWNQATLPVSFGGLGLRSASSLALPTFLSSFSSVSKLIETILPTSFTNIPDLLFVEAESLWFSQTNCKLRGKEKSFQKSWDNPLLEIASQKMVDLASSVIEKARINAVSVKESGAWLNTLPVASLGTLLDDESFRIAVALRLGLSICAPHKCICGSNVEANGVHGLSCRRSAGRLSRHHQVNDLLKRALISAGLPAILEPPGVSRDDGKRPDGMTLIPWRCGKLAVWDFTCADTLAPSHLSSTAKSPGAAAISSEKVKRTKYRTLEDNYFFYPVAVETFGVFAPQSLDFIQLIGKRLEKETQDPRATTFLIQRISIAIQRGNAASILGTIPASRSFDEILLYPYKRNSNNKQHFERIADIQTLNEEVHSSFKFSDYKQVLHCKSWADAPGSSGMGKFSIGKVGLVNLGNSCYMNSVLQALFMTRTFRNEVLLYDKDISQLFSKLQDLFALLQFSTRSSLSPHEILNISRPPGFLQGQQHDSSEFLWYLLDRLHEHETNFNSNEVNPEDEAAAVIPTVVQQYFGGKTLTISRCGECGTKSERVDSFRELQLSFPNQSENQTVQSLMEHYLQPEKLTGDNQYHCDLCSRLTDSERTTRIVEAPARLTLTLKLFRYDPASHQRTKLLQSVTLDEHLTLDNCHYELYAAVFHCGSSVDSGHYYTLARDKTDWFKFNDAYVSKATPENLSRLKPPETPYILFYCREDLSDLENLPTTVLSRRLQILLSKDNSESE